MKLCLSIVLMFFLQPVSAFSQCGVGPFELGKTLEELGAQDYYASPGAPVRYRMMKKTRDGDLYHLDSREVPGGITVTTKEGVIKYIGKEFRESDFEDYAMKYESMYGKGKQTYKNYENSFGAKFKGEVLIWKLKKCLITLEQYGIDLKTSAVHFEELPTTKAKK